MKHFILIIILIIGVSCKSKSEEDSIWIYEEEMNYEFYSLNVEGENWKADSIGIQIYPNKKARIVYGRFEVTGPIELIEFEIYQMNETEKVVIEMKTFSLVDGVKVSNEYEFDGINELELVDTLENGLLFAEVRLDNDGDNTFDDILRFPLVKVAF